MWWWLRKMGKKIGEQQHFEEGDNSVWQVKDKDEKYNFRNNSKTCVENIKIAIQESKFIHAKESKGNKLIFF